jgi:DNA replicative helicase MCM subunit Mcm2 (Cdc46/Mcm family)
LCTPCMYTHTHCNTATATYSEHVLRGHRYRKPGADMEPEPLNARRMDMEDSDPSALGDSDSPVFEKFNPLLHGAVAATATASGSSGSEKRPELLCQAFLKRYMHYAKRIVHPQLCDEARAYIAGAYSELRYCALSLLLDAKYCVLLSYRHSRVEDVRTHQFAAMQYNQF